MTTDRAVLLADTPPRAEARLRALLPEVDFRPVVLASARERAADAGAAVVWLNGDAEGAFRAVGALDARGLRVIVVGARKDADLILRAMREGAKEFVVSEDEAGLVRALRESIRTSRAQEGGVVHAVFAAKGGVGATTLATNLSGALQAGGTRTCLVDLDVAMGDVLAFLDLGGGYSLSDLAKNLSRLDPALLETSLLRHGSGVRVLTAGPPEQAERLEAATVAAALGFLRQHFGAVMVDGLRGLDDLALAAVEASDRILLVLTQEIPAVRDARRCVDLLRRLGCEDKVTVVVNRHRKGQQIDDAVIADTVGLPVGAVIANDYPAVIQAVNRGAFVADDAPRAQVTRDLAALAETLVPAMPGAARAGPAARPGLIGRLLGGRSRDAARG
ncbi:AAA family ATPase [Anaeromyxobacter oryzisoli]|uniref:AAA family ATPase n=1 Tax=Anaeromyxobacter oryzisoli TaxID=2925408 RepID=UPI001F58B1C1|nr:pilus assembly protein CpaE [Anaeromyxobacter sp. SG63]